MPIVSRFFGIVIALYWNDHAPPHFHAKYGGNEATEKTIACYCAVGVKKIPHVVQAKYKKDYQIWLRFNDGCEGIVDLKDELYGEMFKSLRDKKKFKTFRLDPELETIVWKNGADLAPEFLRDHLRV